MYGYEVEIKDELDWKNKKIKIFEILIPILKEDPKTTGLLNADEIRGQIISATKEEIDNIGKDSSKMFDYMNFFENNFFFSNIFNLSSFVDILEKMENYNCLKSFLQGCDFYIKNLYAPTIENSEESKIDEIFEKTFKPIIDKFSIDENLLPKSYGDIEYLTKISDDISHSENIINILRGTISDHVKIDIDNISCYIKQEILNWNSFRKCFYVTDANEEELNSIKGIIQKFIEEYFDSKVTTVKRRKEVIEVLNQYKSSTNKIHVYLMDILNDVLLQDSPNRNAIKADWLNESLNVDSESNDSDSFFS